MSRKEQYLIVIVFTIYICAMFIVNGNQITTVSDQLTIYQDSVNVLIEVNKKLHAAQMSYSDAIVRAMTLQEVEHGN